MCVITFIGAGQMASAITFPAFENGNIVRLVGTPLDREIIKCLKKNDYHPTLKRVLHRGIEYYQIEDVQKALNGADLVVCGVSSFGVEWFANEILKLIPENTPILAVTKGLMDMDDGTVLSYPAYWQSTSDGKKLCICGIGGPCTSYELADHDHSFVKFCGSEYTVLKKMKRILATDYYHISLTEDVQGLEYAVALKNAYALAVSLTIGLCEKNEGEGALHYNSQAAAFTEAVWEMRRLLRLFCGEDQQLDFGAGDLYVTIFGGRTRKLGILLGKGYSIDEALEKLNGVTLESVVITKRMAKAISRLSEIGKAKKSDYPLLFHVNAVLEGEEEADLPWKYFEREQ